MIHKRLVLFFLLISVTLPTVISFYATLKSSSSTKETVLVLEEEESERDGSEKEKEEKEKDKQVGSVQCTPLLVVNINEKTFGSYSILNFQNPVNDLATPPPKLS